MKLNVYLNIKNTQTNMNLNISRNELFKYKIIVAEAVTWM